MTEATIQVKHSTDKKHIVSCSMTVNIDKLNDESYRNYCCDVMRESFRLSLESLLR